MITYNDIISAFRQGVVAEGGNCASVALIKAAIDLFGVNQVFQHQKNGTIYTITLRDGSNLTFTEDELNQTTQRADFHLRKGDDPAQDALYKQIHDYANLCFCAMVKNVMRIGESGDGVGNFENAIEALNDGANSDLIHILLGITNVIGPKIWMSTKDGSGFIVWKSTHCVFASHGQYDHYGEPRPIMAYFPHRMQLVS